MMSTERLTRYLRPLAACSVLAGVIFCAPASAAPYVSCPGGYIANNLRDCPTLVKHPVGGPHTGGGGPDGGLLGDLLGRLGLGGLF